MKTDIKRLTEALYRNDSRAIVRELFHWTQCPECEQLANVELCKAPGCTAVLCPQCLLMHGSYHLEDDPKDQRPI